MARTSQRRPQRANSRDRREAASDERLAEFERLVVGTTVLGCLLLFWRAANDAFSTPKLTFVFLGVLALLGLFAWRGLLAGRVVVPTSPAAVAAVLFAAVAVVTAALSGHGWVAFLGSYRRYVGALPYLAYVALFLTVLRVTTVDWLYRFLWWLTIAVGVIVLYGIVQALDHDPFTWSDAAALQVFSTFGQENFAAGGLAALLPLVFGLALVEGTRSFRGRVAAAVGLATVVVIWRTNSFQGPVAAIAGVAPLALLLVAARWRPSEVGGSRQLRVVLGALGAAAVAAAVLLGPFVLARTNAQLSSGTDERRYLWSAAGKMAGDHAVLGNGFGSYNLRFTAIRPATHAIRYGLLRADAPHNVWLEHLVSGGVVLLLAYLAFVVAVAWALVNGLRRLDGDARLLLAAFGGAWLAYQVQALVSIDVPPVAILQWIAAGAIVALAMPQRQRFISIPRVVRSSGTARLVLAAGAVVAGLAVWFTLYPLRADVLAARARDQHARRDPGAELSSALGAVRLAPWEPSYVTQLASARADAGQLPESAAAGVRAAQLDPGSTSLNLAVAQTYERLGQMPHAEQWYERAVRRDPHAAAPRDALGRFLLRLRRYEDAVGPLRLAASWAPENVPYLIDYATALAANGEPVAAERVFQQARKIEPANATVQQAIAQLRVEIDRPRPG